MAISKKHPATSRYVNASEAVEIQQVNYHEGNTDSVAQSVVRHFEDFFMEFEQNRQTTGYVVSRTDASTIAITAGEALVEGIHQRNTTQFNLDITGFDAGNYYVIVDSNRAAGTEVTRNPTSDGVTITLVASGSLDVNEHLALAKVEMSVSGTLGVNEITENYSADFYQRTDRIMGYNKAYVQILAGTYPNGTVLAQFSGTQVDIYGALIVSGVATFSGNVIVDSNLTVSGTTLMSGAVIVDDALTVSGALTVTGNYNGNDLDALHYIGEANAVDKPLSTGIAMNTGVEVIFALIEGVYSHDFTGGERSINFTLPLETNKAGLKLYIKNIKMVTNYADASHYITTITLYGGWNDNVSSPTLIDSDTTNYTTANDTIEFDFTSTPQDMSSYDYAILKIAVQQTTTPHRATFSHPTMLCYYDT